MSCETPRDCFKTYKPILLLNDLLVCCSSLAHATGPKMVAEYMDAVGISLAPFRAPKRSFCVVSVARCAVFLEPSRCWKPGGLACKPLSTHSYLRGVGGRAFGLGPMLLVWRGFPLLPELWAGLRANLRSRSPAACPRFNLWLCSFARCDAVAVAALCIANSTCLCTEVLVRLMIGGFLIFSWDAAA